jgi:hypothetical protein
MIDIFRASEKIMAMDDATWERHANPLSVWSRLSCLPLITVAIWSRVWLGWFSLIPLALALIWTWVNPRLFPAPRTLTSWASRGVMGERIFLDRAHRAIAHHHLIMANILTIAMALFALVLIYGIWSLNVWATLTGLTGTIGGKIWFVDRMVWLYDETRSRSSDEEVIMSRRNSIAAPEDGN